MAVNACTSVCVETRAPEGEGFNFFFFFFFCSPQQLQIFKHGDNILK